ncbi:hypothetical protein KUTeg_015676 [Tegillarca granosa]|uniref:NAD-dependent epimerase/dehydratase domain-containing protein n=1 Tax=Tegillarca granosa TaxID=220873 RepID=A0ABQ9ENG2_TEGGR|nr:hypothetical protein KUTeg_015676 [Tegillarca granosa]
MKILVTGGAGFIGSNLIMALLQHNHQVVSIDNYYTGKTANLSPFKDNPNFKEYSYDITIPWKDNPEATNIWGTQNLIEFTLAQKSARLLFSSTSEVYGDPHEHPQKESYHGNVNPIGIRACYDEGKRAAETFCFDSKRQFGLNVAVIRIFNTYGINMLPDDGRVVSNFIVQALKGRELTVYGDGTQTRSLCYVDDLVRGIILMMNHPQHISGPINLGNPHEQTVQELAEQILNLTGSSSKIRYLPLPSDDPKKRKPDITLAQQYLDWEPTVPVTTGLTQTISYFKNALTKTTIT